MNAWLIAAIALLPGFIPCGILLWRGRVMSMLIAFNMAGVLAALEVLLLSEGENRAPFYDLALALALLSFGGGLVFARFLERWL